MRDISFHAGAASSCSLPGYMLLPATLKCSAGPSIFMPQHAIKVIEHERLAGAETFNRYCRASMISPHIADAII